MQPVADVGVGRPLQPRPRVVLHTFDGGFGGQTRAHGLEHALQPAAVVGEHAIGLQHFAMLARMAEIGRLQHVVDRAPERIDRLFETLQFEVGVFGDQLGDMDARLVQHGMAERNALAEGCRLDVVRDLAGLVGRLEGLRVDQLGGGHDFGQHHRDRLQRLDLFLGVVTFGAVLHRQHADDLAASEDRHAHQRLVDFFAGFRPVGKTRMRLRIGEIERPCMLGNVADQAFADLQPRVVDGRRLQAFGGREFEFALPVDQIDRADFGDHVGSDQHDDLVEPLLRALRLRHDFAQPAEQNARTADGARHQSGSRSLQRGRRKRVNDLTSVIRRRARRPCAGRARQARYIPTRSAH